MASAQHKCAELRLLLTRAKMLHESGRKLPSVTAELQTLELGLSPAPVNKRAGEANGEANGEASGETSANLRLLT